MTLNDTIPGNSYTITTRHGTRMVVEMQYMSYFDNIFEFDTVDISEITSAEEVELPKLQVSGTKASAVGKTADDVLERHRQYFSGKKIYIGIIKKTLLGGRGDSSRPGATYAFWNEIVQQIDPIKVEHIYCIKLISDENSDMLNAVRVIQNALNTLTDVETDMSLAGYGGEKTNSDILNESLRSKEILNELEKAIKQFTICNKEHAAYVEELSTKNIAENVRDMSSAVDTMFGRVERYIGQ